MKLLTAFHGLRRSKTEKESLKDDIPSRGKYGPLDTISDAPHVKGRKFLQIVPTVALLLAGIALMLAHHFFYSYLDSKIIDPSASDLPPILKDQRIPNIIGTIIAHGACAVFSMIVNSTFAQLFWEKLRTRNYSIKQVDSLAQSGCGPFHSSMFQTMATAPSLYLLSLVAGCMSLIVVFSPGSLTVSSAVQRSVPCNVPSAPNLTDQAVEEEFSYTFFRQIQSTGTYIPPLRVGVCADGALTCSYNVSFAGSAFECLDITDQTDFASSLDSSNAPGNAPSVIWNGTWNELFPYGPFILVSTWDMVKNVMQANNCTAYRATHKVGVTVHARSVNAQIWDTTLESLVGDRDSLDAFIDGALMSLAGTVLAGPNGFLQDLTLGPNLFSDSRFFVTTQSGNHTWSDNITNILTSYMQNASISLLSGITNYTINDVSKNLPYVNSSCVSMWDGYVYKSARLLSTYGIALASTLFVTSLGCLLILRNGIEENVVLSYIIQLVFPQAFEISSSKGNFNFSRLQFRTTPRRRSPGYPDESTSNQNTKLNEDAKIHHIAPFRSQVKVASSPGHKWFLTKLQARRNQMAILTLIGVSCMSLHHIFYSFLDTVSPNSSNTQSLWITQQSIVSDIGIGIAYAAQACLGIAIAISSSQLFWRILTKRGHTISQIDALIKIQRNPFSLSLLHCNRDSLMLILTTVISASMPLISTFAPNAIKLSLGQLQSSDCTVRTPRNLSSLKTTNLSDYSSPLNEVFQTETYIPPENPCSVEFESRCSYGVEVIGPGLFCSDVTASENFTAFADAKYFPYAYGSAPSNAVHMWHSSLAGDNRNRTMRLSVQTWDLQESIYQALECTGVTRAYSLLITHNSSSVIDDIHSYVLSSVLMDPDANLSVSQLELTNNPIASTENNTVTFMQQYLFYTMMMLEGSYFLRNASLGASSAEWLNFEKSMDLFTFPNILSLSGISWNKNMGGTLEQFAQNATLSLLSGQIFLLDSPDGTDLLEDFKTTCNYTITAYEYSPSRLFTTYGVACFLTTLCIIGGVQAILRNGVDESMDFSRFLRAVSNERMFNARERIEMDTVLKADNVPEGGFAPVLESDI